MSIEKPISQIKRAILAGAEELARKESLNKPEDCHFNAVIKILREAKNYSQELFEQAIKTLVEEKELKNKIGIELVTSFEKASYRLLENQERKGDLIDYISKDFEAEIKSEPQIAIEFAGKEKFLDDAIKYIKSNFPKLLQLKKGKI